MQYFLNIKDKKLFVYLTKMNSAKDVIINEIFQLYNDKKLGIELSK